MQSALVAQVVLQALVPQMKGVQELVAGVTQVPVPLQLDIGCSVEVAQVCAMHWIPLAHFRHAPLPSQKPSRPQLAMLAAVQRAVGSTEPLGTSTQVPTDPATAHELQSAVQAVLQQTPCAQNPKLQEALVVQVDPMESRPQLPVPAAAPAPVQVAGATQSVLEVALLQVVLQTFIVVLHA
jgi:hypothetical protein